MSRDIPIIFSAPMIRALIEGRKTQTRRLADAPHRGFSPKRNPLLRGPWCRVQPGDQLWVRENFSGPWGCQKARPHIWPALLAMSRPPIWYWADGNPADGDWTTPRPSIHMPRWASRLTLIVTGAKIEPLQAISEADAMAEGFRPVVKYTEGMQPDEAAEVHRDAARDWYSDLWESLHGVESWRSNPEVVALTFRVIHANIDAPEARAA